ncbi:hypothetical protein ACFVIM_22220 [Streptomyces sp. NPDC057638]|uniref:hypothetical protein n=1 Tax=Streptomyces sp. NPDC057638 TaxID=3346190 RepID=UPI0036A0C800
MPADGRERVRASEETVVARYRGGETIKGLAAEYRVSDAWLKKQLTGWGVAVRDVRAARVLRAQQRRDQP